MVITKNVYVKQNGLLLFEQGKDRMVIDFTVTSKTPLKQTSI
jgi:hypothetical protein